MANVAEIILLITGKDEASKTLRGISKTAAGVGKKLSGALKAGAIGGAVAVAGLGVASLKMAADFDQSMREVNTLIDLPEAAFRDLKNDVLDLSKEMGIVAGDVVPALYSAISAGVPSDNAIEFMRVASAAAIGGVTDLETAVDGLTTGLNAFQLPIEDAQRVSDTLFVGMKAGKTTIAELSASLFQVAPIANAAGIGIEETVAAMSALTTAGVPTTVAANQVRAAIVSMMKPGGDMAKVFQEAGFASGQSAIEQLGLAKAMGIVATAADGDIGALTKLTGRIEGAQAILSLTGAQAETFAGVMDDMGNKTGATTKAMDEMNKGVSRQWALLKNKLNVALIQLGTKMLPHVIKALEKLGPFIDKNLPKMVSLFKEVARVAKPFVESFVTGAGMIIRALRPVVEFIVNNKPVLVAALLAIGVAVLVALGPVSLAVIGIIAFVTLIGWMKDNMGEILSAIGGMFRAFGSAITGAIDDAIGWISDNWPIIAALLSGPFAPLVLLATDAFGVRSALTDALDAMLTKAGEIIDGIAAFMTGLPGVILTALGDLTSTLTQKGKDLISGFIKGMLSIPIPNPLNLVPGGGAVTGFIGGAVGAVTSLGGLRAAGGPVAAGRGYLVGENGPEFFVPGQNGQIVPNGGGMGGGLSLTLNGDVNVYPTREARTPRATLADVAFATVAELHARGMMVAS